MQGFASRRGFHSPNQLGARVLQFGTGSHAGYSTHTTVVGTSLGNAEVGDLLVIAFSGSDGTYPTSVSAGSASLEPFVLINPGGGSGGATLSVVLAEIVGAGTCTPQCSFPTTNQSVFASALIRGGEFDTGTHSEVNDTTLDTVANLGTITPAFRHLLIGAAGSSPSVLGTTPPTDYVGQQAAVSSSLFQSVGLSIKTNGSSLLFPSGTVHAATTWPGTGADKVAYHVAVSA